MHSDPDTKIDSDGDWYSCAETSDDDENPCVRKSDDDVNYSSLSSVECIYLPGKLLEIYKPVL